MAEPFLGEVRIFTFNFPPKGWATCDGRLLPINQNQALFSLMETTFGGDGRVNFALPDLCGRSVLHPGMGPGLTERMQGETGGSEQVALATDEMPIHRHTLKKTAAPVSTNIPGGTRYLAKPTAMRLYAPNTARVPLSPKALRIAGEGAAHENMMPYLTYHFCIALEGIFPSRP